MPSSATTCYVALLRGVNVGKAKRVRMADLVALLEELGYTDVATLLNSGNAVFRAAKGTSAQHAARIAGALATELHVEAPVVVKSAREFAAIVAENPVQTPADPSRLLVVFTQDRRGLSTLAAIQPLVAPREHFLIGKHAAYLECPDGLLESQAGAALLGKAGRAATTRNWKTVSRLLEMVKERTA